MAYFPEAFPALLNPPVLPAAPVVTPTSTTAGQVTCSWSAVNTPANADPAYQYRAQVVQNVTTDPRFNSVNPNLHWDTFWSGTVNVTWTGSALFSTTTAGTQNVLLRSRGNPNDGGACAGGDTIVVQGRVRSTSTDPVPPHITLLTNTTGVGTAQYFATGVTQQIIELTASASWVDFRVQFTVPDGDDLYNIFCRNALLNVGETSEWDDLFVWRIPAAAWTTTTNTSITFTGLSAGQDYTAFVQARNLAGWSALSVPEQVMQATATLNGGGTLTASGTREVTASASMSGGGTLTATGAVVPMASATMNGGGTLTASATQTRTATATMNGGGTLSASSFRVQSASASMAGGGTLTATGVRGVPATATLLGGGTLTATGVREVTATATFNGAGTLLATAGGGLDGIATFLGGGTLTASGFRVVPATVSLAGGGTLTATGVRSVPSTATLTGGGTLTATGTRVVPATAALAAGGTLTVSGTLVRPATATFTGAGTLLATGSTITTVTGSAAFAQAHTLTALCDLIEGLKRIAAASLPPSFTQVRDLWRRGGAGRLTVRSTVPTQRWLLLEQPSATYPLGRVVATSEPVRLDGWDDVIADPESYTTTGSSWQASVLQDNGYDLEAVT